MRWLLHMSDSAGFFSLWGMGSSMTLLPSSTLLFSLLCITITAHGARAVQEFCALFEDPKTFVNCKLPALAPGCSLKSVCCILITSSLGIA